VSKYEKNTPFLQDQVEIIDESLLERLLHRCVTHAILVIKTLDQELHLIGGEACHLALGLTVGAGTLSASATRCSIASKRERGDERIPFFG
jgi:hypothetical protein